MSNSGQSRSDAAPRYRGGQARAPERGRPSRPPGAEGPDGPVSAFLGKSLIPEDEDERLRSLERLRVLERPDDDPALREITALLAELFGVPYATVSFVGADSQWFRGAHGLAIDGTERSHAFCARTVARGDLVVIEDTLGHPEFADSPLLLPPSEVRFYAGVPLFDENGHALGALSVMDRVPRPLDAGGTEVLRGLARRVMAHLREPPPPRSPQVAANGSDPAYRMLMDRVGEAVLLHGPDRTIVEGNGVASVLLGREGSDLLGIDSLAVFVLEDRGRAEEHYDVARTRGHARMEARLRRPDGTLIKAGIDSALLPGGLVQDVITNLSEAREREHRDRLLTTGQVAAGVAHDFNNLLTVVRSHLYLAEEILDEAERVPEETSSEIRASLREADDVVGTAGALAQQLLALGGRRRLEPTRIDLESVVAAFGGVLSANMRPGVRLDITAAGVRLPVWFDETQLKQVLLNFVFNAQEAIQDRGTVAVEIAPVFLSGDFAPCGERSTKGRFALLSVTDDGEGMHPDVVHRVFDPFFTTKGPTGGTGLGLATVRGIVLQSEGCVWAQSQPGVGTTMNVLLPLLQEEGEAGPLAGLEGARAGELRDEGGTILLVEPRAPLRHMLLGRLSNWHFRVLEADGIDTARRLLAAPRVPTPDTVIASGSLALDGLLAGWAERASGVPGIVLVTPPGAGPPLRRRDGGRPPRAAPRPSPAGLAADAPRWPGARPPEVLDPPYGPISLLRAVHGAHAR